MRVDTFPIEGGHTQCRIGFSILSRAGHQQGLVLYIDRKGSGQPRHFCTHKYVVLECLRALQNIGYDISTYSSTRIGALNVGLHYDIGRYYAQLAKNNINDVVSLITYI